MKVILMKDVTKLGLRGKVIDVADSYAVNVLIPKGMVIQATPAEIAKWKQKEDGVKKKKELETNTFVQLLDKLQKEPIIISGKKHTDGHLFAQIKETDIVDAIFNSTKLSVDPKQIIIGGQIKNLGLHKVKIKQGDKIGEVFINIK